MPEREASTASTAAPFDLEEACKLGVPVAVSGRTAHGDRAANSPVHVQARNEEIVEGSVQFQRGLEAAVERTLTHDAPAWGVQFQTRYGADGNGSPVGGQAPGQVECRLPQRRQERRDVEGLEVEPGGPSRGGHGPGQGRAVPAELDPSAACVEASKSVGGDHPLEPEVAIEARRGQAAADRGGSGQAEVGSGGEIEQTAGIEIEVHGSGQGRIAPGPAPHLRNRRRNRSSVSAGHRLDVQRSSSGRDQRDVPARGGLQVGRGLPREPAVRSPDHPRLHGSAERRKRRAALEARLRDPGPAEERQAAPKFVEGEVDEEGGSLAVAGQLDGAKALQGMVENSAEEEFREQRPFSGKAPIASAAGFEVREPQPFRAGLEPEAGLDGEWQRSALGRQQLEVHRGGSGLGGQSAGEFGVPVRDLQASAHVREPDTRGGADRVAEEVARQVDAEVAIRERGSAAEGRGWCPKLRVRCRRRSSCPGVGVRLPELQA